MNEAARLFTATQTNWSSQQQPRHQPRRFTNSSIIFDLW